MIPEVGNAGPFPKNPSAKGLTGAPSSWLLAPVLGWRLWVSRAGPGGLILTHVTSLLCTEALGHRTGSVSPSAVPHEGSA